MLFYIGRNLSGSKIKLFQFEIALYGSIGGKKDFINLVARAYLNLLH
jgi:hypothetical protein